jgi:hypothetical protein
MYSFKFITKGSKVSIDSQSSHDLTYATCEAHLSSGMHLNKSGRVGSEPQSARWALSWLDNLSFAEKIPV